MAAACCAVALVRERQRGLRTRQAQRGVRTQSPAWPRRSGGRHGSTAVRCSEGACLAAKHGGRRRTLACSPPPLALSVRHAITRGNLARGVDLGGCARRRRPTVLAERRARRGESEPRVTATAERVRLATTGSEGGRCAAERDGAARRGARRERRGRACRERANWRRLVAARGDADAARTAVLRAAGIEAEAAGRSRSVRPRRRSSMPRSRWHATTVHRRLRVTRSEPPFSALKPGRAPPRVARSTQSVRVPLSCSRGLWPREPRAFVASSEPRALGGRGQRALLEPRAPGARALPPKADRG